MEYNEEEIEFMMAIEQKKDIISSLHQYNPAFEHGVEASIEELKKRLDVAEMNISYYSRKEFKGEDPTEIDIEYLNTHDENFDGLIEHCQEKEWIEDQLAALGEMKILFLFKNLEIAMKSLIKRGYEKINTKSFYKWNNLKAFFDEKGILIHELDGYAEVLQVKKVSNNIKHNDELTDEINKIPEFVGGMEFADLNAFFDRVKPKVAIFQKQLSEAVIKELFEFDDKKIEGIVEEMKGRMNRENVIELISKLKAQYGL